MTDETHRKESVSPEPGKAAGMEPGGPPPDDPLPPRSARREQAACDALRAFIRDHALHQFGTGQPVEDRIGLTLRLTLHPRDGWQVRPEPPLSEQVHEQLQDMLSLTGAYLRGAVYCFRCASSVCGHGVPTDPLHVFSGYTSTGIPQWHEMVQALIEAGDERVDQLYGRPPALLARIQLGRELREQQLTPFGRSSRTYAILGQVVAGYFMPAANRGMDFPERFALTLQVVETREAGGGTGVRLNRIAGGLEQERFEEFLVSDEGSPVAEAILRTEQKLGAMEAQVRAARQTGDLDRSRTALRQVPGILRELVRSLERSNRQGQRRTRHARQHRPQQRPVHKAMDDARSLSAENCFYDEKRGTWIVCGRQGRTHAFNDEGRHVTSFVLAPEAPEFRVRTHRWRHVTVEELERLRGFFLRERET